MKKHIESVRNFSYIDKKRTGEGEGEAMVKTNKAMAIGLISIGILMSLSGCSSSMTDKEINDTIVDKLNSKYSDDEFRVKDVRPLDNSSGSSEVTGYTADVYSHIYDKGFTVNLTTNDNSITDNYYKLYFGDKLEGIADKFEAELSEYDIQDCDVIYTLVNEVYTEDEFNKFLSDRQNENQDLVSIDITIDNKSDIDEVVEHAENLVDIGDRNKVYYDITWTSGDNSITYTSSEVTSKTQVEQQFRNF